MKRSSLVWSATIVAAVFLPVLCCAQAKQRNAPRVEQVTGTNLLQFIDDVHRAVPSVQNWAGRPQVAGPDGPESRPNRQAKTQNTTIPDPVPSIAPDLGSLVDMITDASTSDADLQRMMAALQRTANEMIMNMGFVSLDQIGAQLGIPGTGAMPGGLVGGQLPGGLDALVGQLLPQLLGGGGMDLGMLGALGGAGNLPQFLGGPGGLSDLSALLSGQ